MSYTEIDLSSVSTHYGAVYQNGVIIATGAGIAEGAFRPDVALDPTQKYQIRFDYDTTGYPTNGSSLWVYSNLPDPDPDQSWWEELGRFDVEPGSTGSKTVVVGPGLSDWDDAVARGENYFIVNFNNMSITGARYRLYQSEPVETSTGRLVQWNGHPITAFNYPFPYYDDTGSAGHLIGLTEETMIWQSQEADQHHHYRVMKVDPTGTITQGPWQVFWAAPDEYFPHDASVIDPLLTAGNIGQYDTAHLLRVNDTEFCAISESASLDSVSPETLVLNAWYQINEEDFTITRTAVATSVYGSNGNDYRSLIAGTNIDDDTVVVFSYEESVQDFTAVAISRSGPIGTPQLAAPGERGALPVYCAGKLCVFERSDTGGFGSITMNVYSPAIPVGGVVASLPIAGTWGSVWPQFGDVKACAVGDRIALVTSTPENAQKTAWGSIAFTWVDPVAMTHTTPVVLTNNAGIQGTVGGLVSTGYRGQVRAVSGMPNGNAFVAWIDFYEGNKAKCAIITPEGEVETFAIDGAPTIDNTGAPRWHRLECVGLTDYLVAVLIVGPTNPGPSDSPYGNYLMIGRFTVDEVIDGAFDSKRNKFWD